MSNGALVFAIIMTCLIDAVHGKIILEALCSNTYCEPAIGATCRFRTSPGIGGLAHSCDTRLDLDSIQVALSEMRDLPAHVGNGNQLEAGDVYKQPSFRASLVTIAQAMLCDDHRRGRGVDHLVNRLASAIQQAALAEHQKQSVQYSAVLRAATDRALSEASKASRRPHMPPVPKRDMHFSAPSLEAKPNLFGDPVSIRGMGSHCEPGTVDKDTDRGQRKRPWTQLKADIEGPVIVDLTGQSATVTTQAEPGATDGPQAEQPTSIINNLCYPVISGRPTDVTERNVLNFYRIALTMQQNRRAFLIKEKIKWHPDKIDHRYAHAVDKEELKEIASVIIRALLKLCAEKQ